MAKPIANPLIDASPWPIRKVTRSISSVNLVKQRQNCKSTWKSSVKTERVDRSDHAKLISSLPTTGLLIPPIRPAAFEDCDIADGRGLMLSV